MLPRLLPASVYLLLSHFAMPPVPFFLPLPIPRLNTALESLRLFFISRTHHSLWVIILILYNRFF